MVVAIEVWARRLRLWREAVFHPLNLFKNSEVALDRRELTAFVALQYWHILLAAGQRVGVAAKLVSAFGLLLGRRGNTVITAKWIFAKVNLDATYGVGDSRVFMSGRFFQR